MRRDIKREILEYVVQNDFYRRVLFESDYNEYKEGYIEKLKQIKEKKEIDLYSIIKDKDITKDVLNMLDKKSENEAMIEFILNDTKLTEFILKVLKEYLNIGVEIPEVVYLKDMPKDLLEGLTNQLREKQDKLPLTRIQQKYFKEIEEHDYNITIEELAQIMGATLYNTRIMIKRIENRGYDIINIMNSSTQLREKQDKLPLTRIQQKYFNVIEEHDYNIRIVELAEIMGVTAGTVSTIITRIEEKGYTIRNSSTQLKEVEMSRDIKREILEYVIQNDFYRKVVFESDCNKDKEGYIKKLEQIKEKKEIDLYSIIKDKDMTKDVLNMLDKKSENEAMIEFILNDTKLTEFILKVLEEYLNIGVEIPEVVYLKDMPKDLLEGLTNRNIKRLTSTQQKYLNVIKEHDYNITIEELAEIMGVTAGAVSNIITRIEEKGYTIRRKIREVKGKLKAEKNSVILSENQIKLLDIYLEEGYDIQQEDIVKKMNIERLASVTEITEQLINKFSKFKLSTEDTIRIIDLIKNKGKLGKLLDMLETTRKINYDNIAVLIDTLLQEDKEDKNNEINFVINYEQILMNRELERVEEPLYQLLVKYKVKLNKEQCSKISKLMEEYEKRIKIEEDNSNTEVVEELKGEEQEEMEL